MKLISFSYYENKSEKSEWNLDEVTLGPLNLIVGKNASGKTRTLNIIGNLAKLLCGKISIFNSANYDLRFDHEGNEYTYKLQVDKRKVVKEYFSKCDNVLLDREKDGRGFIFAEKEGKNIEFQHPDNEIAAYSRRDLVQHPFFNILYDWGISSRHYHFGTSLGKDIFILPTPTENAADPDPHNTEATNKIFHKAKLRFGKNYIDAVKADMNDIGYNIEEVDLIAQEGIIINKPIPVTPLGLSVKESDLDGFTYQSEISQGMFRALSIIIQLNFSLFLGNPSCIIIDDIGEGLDFERSCLLIDLLMKKADKSNVQLIMSTNDRFVMNKAPLESWSLLVRNKNRVHVYNYINSKSIFDEFKFTGLNNFDFFAIDFIHQEHNKDE